MICKCPNCSAALVFNPQINLLECNACGSVFDPKQFEEDTTMEEVMVDAQTYQPVEEEVSPQIPQQTQEDVSQKRMQCNIYRCTACGAELMVNGVETSTYCAYCGQPTIVFSRVSSELQPDYIIPFQIPKDEALKRLNAKFRKGFFIPQEVKHYKVDTLRGIYIPFWLYDMHFYDAMYWSGRVKRGKSSVTKYYYRECQCDFKNLSVDASYILNDEMSQRLEPYSTNEMIPFDVAYLSGFYADRYDMDQKTMYAVARQRGYDCFVDEVSKSINASNKKVLQSSPNIQTQHVSYALLPAWFLTFRYQNDVYTMLINGQTGKVVGSVPVEKNKVIGASIIFAIVFSLIMIMICILTFMGMSGSEDSENPLKFIGFLLVLGGIATALGFSFLKKLKANIALTKEKNAQKFVKERQEG